MSAIWSFIVAFARFWYKFIVGDDWTLALTVAVGLVATWALVQRGVSAWWLVPGLVVVAVSVSILRAPLTPAKRKPEAQPSKPETAAKAAAS